MDQLTAYKILGLEPGSSPEEIKEAYAALSKQYHPEEEPEKFQEIHEAYVTLTRRKRRVSVENVYQEEQNEDSKEETLNFNNVEIQGEERKEPEYAFDDAMMKAQKQEDEKLHELVLEAGAELKVLASPKYNSNLKAYRTFFEDKKYEQIFRRAEFLEKLCEVLETTKLKKNIYDYIIDFYRLRGMQPSDLSPIGLRLYQVLDEKAGIKQKVNPGVYGGVAVAIISLFRAMRPIIRESEIFTGIVFGLFAVFLLVWVVKKLKEKRSALFSQAVIAIMLAISQFIVIMFDVYGTLFGSVDAGNSVAAVVLLLALVWFVVVIVVAVIKAIIKIINALKNK